MGGGSQFASSGRGGAGNFVDSANSPKLQPQDLQTPTLKTNIVTTGRGGSGNMAPNKDPVETRARQDVEPVKRRESQGAQHSGRGGAGNIFKGDEAEQAKKAVNDTVIVEEQEKDKDKDKDSDKEKQKPKDEPKGLAAKGKAFLGLGKKD